MATQELGQAQADLENAIIELQRCADYTEPSDFLAAIDNALLDIRKVKQDLDHLQWEMETSERMSG